MSNQTATKKTGKAEEKRKEYNAAIKRTLLPLTTGVLLGLISFAVTIFITGDLRRVGVFILVLVFIGIYIHRWTLPLINAISKGENLASKDWMYIGFLVLMSWFISWTILINL